MPSIIKNRNKNPKVEKKNTNSIFELLKDWNKIVKVCEYFWECTKLFRVGH